MCWSKVGMDAEQVTDISQATMNLNLKGISQDFQRYLVIHEFGHALGLEHEHQRSDFWRVASKFLDIELMRKDPRLKWVNFATDILELPSRGHTSEYDADSIMHYW